MIPARIGCQIRVARLIALHAGLDLGLIELRTGRRECRLTALQLPAADEPLVLQLAKAPQFGGIELVVRLRRGQRRLRRLQAQSQIGRVQLRQHLAGTHVVAQIGASTGDLAGHSKSQA